MQHSPPEKRKQFDKKPQEEHREEEKMEKKKEEKVMTYREIKNRMRGLKGYFTRNVKYLQTLVDEHEKDEKTHAKLNELLDILMSTKNKMEECAMDLCACPEYDDQDEDLYGYYEEIDRWDRRIKREYSFKKQRRDSGSSQSEQEEAKPWISVTEMNFDVRKLIKPFKGNPEEYATFKLNWKGVEKSLNKMGKLDAEKLIELKKVLEGKPANQIKNYQDVD